MSEEEAFRAAIATWPAGVRPVVHWSEARDDKRPAVSGVGGPGALRGPRQRCLQWGAWVLTHTHTHVGSCCIRVGVGAEVLAVSCVSWGVRLSAW